MRRHVTVLERGSCDVAAADWAALARHADFWKIVERGIVRAIARPDGRGRLEGAGWVGRIRFADIDLDVTEKIPGALGGLLRVDSRPNVRVEVGAAVVRDAGVLLAQIAEAFVREVRQYASSGLEFHYRSEPEVAALIAGRLNVRGTTRLRAQGRRHLLAFERSAISQDTELNRIAVAGLREVERLSRFIDLPTTTVVTARGLAPLFANARDPRTLALRRGALATRAREHAGRADARWPSLLRLAGALLAAQGFSLENSTIEDVPRSWFVDLESLFEREVRRVLQDAAPAGMVVTTDAGRPSIFETPNRLFRADPDFVVERASKPIVTGDVKYKDWPGADAAGALHSDLYQLLVHAKAHGTEVGMLVFPGANYEERVLTNAATGSDILLTALDMKDLEGSAKKAVTAALALVAARREASEAAETLREAMVSEEREDLVVAATQRQAIKALRSMIQRVDKEQVTAVRRILERTITPTWAGLNEDVRTMLLSAVYFGLHADQEGLDLSGPVLGLFACCEFVAKIAVTEGLGQKEAATIRRATFGQIEKAIRGDTGPNDPRRPILARWLSAQTPEMRALTIEAAEDMERLKDLRNKAAHAELLDASVWETAFDAILAPGKGDLLARLAQVAGANSRASVATMS
jgi:hypothetical protein